MNGREPKAEHFAKAITGLVVEASSITLEIKACSTGEYILYGYRELAKRNFQPRSILIVQKPYMERRAYASFIKAL